MDTINDTIKKVKEVADAACKKTGEVISVQKQKIDILTLKNQLNDVYASLGKAVIKDESINLENYNELTTKIEELNAKIKQKQDEISKINGKEFCANCGKAIEKEISFCPHCGSKI